MATKMTREEAINIVRNIYQTDKEKEALATLIPELAESEDERIRRWLCDYFSSIDKAWIHKDITCIDILRWLEKQKEQKQEKFPPYVTGFKGDPDPAGTSDLEEAAKEYASKTLCDPDDGPSTGLAKESFIAGAKWQKEQKPAEWDKEDLEGKQMIKELKERIVGLDNNGNPIAAAPPDIPMIVEKVNEIIRYINEWEGDHFREPTKTMEEEALSWAGSSAVDAFKAGVEWLKEQDATQRK